MKFFIKLMLKLNDKKIKKLMKNSLNNVNHDKRLQSKKCLLSKTLLNSQQSTDYFSEKDKLEQYQIRHWYLYEKYYSK